MSDLYIALVDYGEHGEREFVTSLDLGEFYSLIIEKLLGYFGSNYPEIRDVVPCNAKIYMTEYSDEDYQDVIAEMLNLLSGDRPNPVVSYIKVQPDIENNQVIGFETDLV